MSGLPYYRPGICIRLIDQAPLLAAASGQSRTGAREVLRMPLVGPLWRRQRSELATIIIGSPHRQILDFLPCLQLLHDVPLQDMNFQPEHVMQLPNYIHNALTDTLLGDQRHLTWADLGGMTVEALLHLPGIGPISIQATVEFLIDIGLQLDHRILPTTSPAVKQTTTPQGKPDQAADAARPGRRRHNPPSATQPLLFTVDKPVTADEDSSPAAQLTDLLNEFNETQRLLLDSRVLQPVQTTLQEVGDQLNLSRERVRQLQKQTEKFLRYLAMKYRTLVAHSEKLHEQLGMIVPDQHQLSSATFREIYGADPHPLHRRLFFWLGGFRAFQDGLWLHHSTSLATLRDELRRNSPATGLSAADAGDLLEEHGCHRAFTETILRAAPRLHHWHDRWFGHSLTIADKAALVLSDLGQPATVTRIMELADLTNHVRNVQARLYADDRFMRTSTQHFALTEWNLPEYLGVPDTMAALINSAGGIMDLNELVDTVENMFGVRRGTIRAYAGAPMFVLENQHIRLRREGEPYEIPDRIPRRKGVFRYPQQLVLILRVTDDMFRGSGRPLHGDIAVSLGVTPGSERTFRGTGFDLRITYPMSGWAGGSLGSVKPVLELLSGTPRAGQILRLNFRLDEQTVSARLTGPDELEAMQPFDALHFLTGVQATEIKDAEAQLDDVLGHPMGGPASTLRARGDTRAAELLEQLRIL